MMRVRSMVSWLLLSLALLQCAKLIVAQEVDDFDGLDEPVQTSAPVSTPAAAAVPYQAPGDFLWLETGSWTVAFFYVLVYWIGKRKNVAIAEEWLEENEPLLVKEFSYTGASADPKVGLLDESVNNYKYFCSGRRFCSRFTADLQLVARHDLFSRMFTFFSSSEQDYLTIDVALNAADVDPIIFSVSKTLLFNNLVKLFPELLSTAKRVPCDLVPESLCVATDSIEVPKLVLNKALQESIKELEEFLEFIVVTDMNNVLVVGFPATEQNLLRLRFKLNSGSKKLDTKKVTALTLSLVDALGASIKLPHDAKRSAQKKRVKSKPVANPAVIKANEQLRRQQELREKKQKEYESLSYEEQQKYDAQQKKKQARKMLNRKK